MKQSGFSLLELSIVLTIMAVVVAGGLSLGTAKSQQDAMVNTYDEMEEIATALRVFLNENNRLPCPASINLASSNALYGREATDCSDASPPSGLTRVEYPAASGKYVRIGGVPFYSLQLPDKYLGDDWNGRYLYAVQETAITSLTTSSTGNIRVVDDSGNVITDVGVTAIVSLGKSHKGAYAAKSGTLFLACDATNKDKENCDADGIFTDAVFNDGSTAANFFDDLIIWKTRANLFEAVAEDSDSGFKPWEIGPGYANGDYPLVVKGASTADATANLGYAGISALCAATYAGSWFARTSDLQYVGDFEQAVTSYARVYADDAIAADNTGNTVNLPTVAGQNYVNTNIAPTLNNINCNGWTDNTASYRSITIRALSTTWRSSGVSLFSHTCNTALKALCVAEAP